MNLKPHSHLEKMVDNLKWEEWSKILISNFINSVADKNRDPQKVFEVFLEDKYITDLIQKNCEIIEANLTKHKVWKQNWSSAGVKAFIRGIIIKSDIFKKFEEYFFKPMMHNKIILKQEFGGVLNSTGYSYLLECEQYFENYLLDEYKKYLNQPSK